MTQGNGLGGNGAGTVQDHRAEAAAATAGAEVVPLAEQRRILRLLARLTANIRKSQLARLHKSREAVFRKAREIPDRMQQLTNQVRLMLDLVDDYSSGRYRKVRWYSLAVAVAAALYFISPSDLIPDALPGIGQLDDLLIMAIALRLLKADLSAYARYKGLDPADYF
jgi:uncharacterized membrane protein YkvA (DUF1232 family)